MHDDGSDQHQVTDSLAHGGDPIWSLDGQRISFISGEEPHFSVSMIHSNGSNQHKLCSDIGSDYPVYYYHLDWSPSNEKIAFVSYLDNRADIAVVDVENNRVTTLTNNSEQDKDPSWSPDGSKIAYVAKKSGIDYLYVMSADGSHQISTAAANSGDKFEQWFQLTELDRSFQGDTPPLPVCREFLKTSHQELSRQFQSGTDIEELIHARGWLIDQVLNR